MQRKQLVDIRFLDGHNHGLGARSRVFRGSAAGLTEARTDSGADDAFALHVAALRRWPLFRAGEELSLTWFGIGEPSLIHSQPNQLPDRR
jgi:hypothetical protein